MAQFNLKARLKRLRVRLAKKRAEGKEGRWLISRIETLEGHRDERFPIVLRTGDRGPKVKALQRRLNRWVKRKDREGKSLRDPWTDETFRLRTIDVDGRYGKATEEMVTGYELETGKLPDGKASRAMLKTLNVAALTKQIIKTEKAAKKKSRILTREQWGADPRSVGRFGRMPGPVNENNVHHSVTPRPGASLASFKQAVKRIEGIGLSRFGVFSYSFAYARGRAAEGAGWDHVGAHTGGRNSSSYGHVFIGNFENDKLLADEIASFGRNIGAGKNKGKVRSTTSINPHQKFSATACPGANIVNSMGKLRAAA